MKILKTNFFGSKLFFVFLIFIALIFSGCSVSNISDREFEGIRALQGALKDPSTMRIYGDILGAEMEVDGEKCVVLSIEYDGKNEMGAYNGSSYAEVFLYEDEKPSICVDGDDGYMDLRNFYEIFSTVKEKQDEGLFSGSERVEDFLDHTQFYWISGKDVSKALDVEYMEF